MDEDGGEELPRARPPRRQRRRLRPGRLHPLRAGQGRGPPPDRRRARRRRAGGAARRARRPLRRSARAAGEPDHAPAGADQARRGRRARGHVPPGPARRHADRARLRARQADPRGDPRRALRVRASRSSPCACPRIPRSASPPSCARPTCCSRSSASRLRRSAMSFEQTAATLDRDHETIADPPGARAPFLCRRPSLAGCGETASRATRSPTVDGTTIEKADFEHWLDVAAKSSGPANATVPDPPDFTSCIAAAQEDRGEAGQGPAEARPTRQLKKQCKQQYDQLRDQVAAAADHLPVDRGRGRGAGRQGHRRRGQEVLRPAEEADLPEGRRLREVPQGLGPDRTRTCSCA